jgi:DNA modification methylase
MEINRTWAMPDSRTFNIEPIRRLLCRYCKEGMTIIDPFANQSKFGTITNDLNPEYDTDYHLDALEFLKRIESSSADIVLYDPPYSLTQASQCYKSYGKDKLEVNVANMKYWSLCKENIARIIHKGGYAICFGWNTNGIGLNRKFEMKEIMLVAHGGSKNDTIATVEQKIQEDLFL